MTTLTNPTPEQLSEAVARLHKTYFHRQLFWMREAEKYNRGTHGRREAVALANCYVGVVEDLSDLLRAHGVEVVFTH